MKGGRPEESATKALSMLSERGDKKIKSREEETETKIVKGFTSSDS